MVTNHFTTLIASLIAHLNRTIELLLLLPHHLKTDKLIVRENFIEDSSSATLDRFCLPSLSLYSLPGNKYSVYTQSLDILKF